MFADISQFADHLLDHYVAFATGSVPVMILGIYERWKNRPVSFRFYVVVFLAFGFVAAGFQTWREEHAARNALEKHWERSPEIVRHLQKMYAEVSEFNRRAYAVISGPDADFQELSKEVHVWSGENGRWILDNMGTAAYYRVIQNSGQIPQHGDNLERAKLSVVLQIMQQNLGQLVENSAWDKR
jgi:hypothetical protein